MVARVARWVRIAAVGIAAVVLGVVLLVGGRASGRPSPTVARAVSLHPASVTLVRTVFAAKLPRPKFHRVPSTEPKETEPVSGPPRTTGVIALAPQSRVATAPGAARATRGIPVGRAASVARLVAAGISSTGFVPPDTQVAVSPRFVVEFVNDAGDVFNHHGKLVKSFDLGALFSGKPGQGSDPKILFDGSTGQFFATFISAFTRGGGPSQIDLAVTADPTANWTIYRVQARGILMDQPKLGISLNKLTIAWNDIGGSGPPEFEVVQKAGIVARHHSVPAGTLPRDSSRTNISPAIQFNGAIALAAFHNLDTGDAGVLDVTGTPGISTTTVQQFGVSVAGISAPPGARQPHVGGAASPDLDTGDDRLESTVLFRSDLWTAGNDICRDSGDTASRSCLRLIDIGLAPLRIKHDVDITMVGADAFYPALTFDADSNLWIAFSSSSKTQFASSEIAELPRGSVAPPVSATIYHTGTGAPNCGSKRDPRNRFGDYSGAAVDPAVKRRGVWVATEFGVSGCSWRTELGSFTP